MNRLPSTSSIRAPDARRMNSGDAPTALNARTGLSTPPGSIAFARVKSAADRFVLMADGRLSYFDRREIRQGNGEEPHLVLVVRPRPCGVECPRRAVEIALDQKAGREAQRRAVRRRILLERT